MHQNCDLKGINFLIDFSIDFLSIFLRFGSPTWGYVGPLDTPKTPPRRFQDASKRAPKTKCATFFAPALILVDFGSIVRRIFGRFVGQCLIDFWCNYLLKINSPKRGGGYAALLRFGSMIFSSNMNSGMNKPGAAAASCNMKYSGC